MVDLGPPFLTVRDHETNYHAIGQSSQAGEEMRLASRPRYQRTAGSNGHHVTLNGICPHCLPFWTVAKRGEIEIRHS